MNKNRTIILVAHYHVGDSHIYSSKDEKYIAFTTFDNIRAFIQNFGKPKNMYYSSSDKIVIIYLTYTFCNMYNYYIDEDEYAKFLIKEKYEIADKKLIERRKELGYVHTYRNPLPLVDLWGKLPKQIILDNLEYLSSGTAWGYFGASERMFKHDEWITELYEIGDSKRKEQISQFLNHSSARHFMDNICPETSKEEFIKTFNSYIRGTYEN